jgi:hypothetical protein
MMYKMLDTHFHAENTIPLMKFPFLFPLSGLYKYATEMEERVLHSAFNYFYAIFMPRVCRDRAE